MTFPTPIPFNHADPERSLAAFAQRMNVLNGPEARWAVSGPGVVGLRAGALDSTAIGVVASGGPMFTMSTRIPTPENPANAIEMDVAFTPKRFRVDRRSVSRAFRYALQNPRHVTLSLSGTSVDVPVLRPFAAYVVELARYREAPRGSVRRARAGERAFELYQRVGAEHISRELQGLRLLSGRDLSREGLRRGDVDAFVAWHTLFLKERSPQAKPPAGSTVANTLRKAYDWGAGRDLDRTDSAGR